MKNLFLVITLSLVSGFSSFAQKTVFLTFAPKMNDADLNLNTVVDDINGTKMTIYDFNYYVSNIEIIHDGGQVLFLDTVLLYKVDRHTQDVGIFDIQNVEQINFGVGVPEPKNHLDIANYKEGDLDPLGVQDPSMYWGWTSGYATLMFNGRGDTNGDNVPNALYQLHTFGDQNYKNVSLPTGATHESDYLTITLYCNIEQWLRGSDPASTGVQHDVTGINADVMDNIDNYPVFTSPSNASIENVKEYEGSVYFYNNNDVLNIKWEDIYSLSSVKLIDMSGKVIENVQRNEQNGSLKIQNVKSGQYVIQMLNSDGYVINSIKAIN
jgi:hypothetical protein